MAIYIGLISGTSTDGIDAVAVDIDDSGQTRQLSAQVTPYSSDLREKIFALQADTFSFEDYGTLDTLLGQAFAQAASNLVTQAGLETNLITAIGSHGQTLFHQPDTDTPFTLQLGDPSIIAEHTGITTVADFRRRDIAAGGQGAPLVPAFHQAWLKEQKNTVVLNLGGIANITVLTHRGNEPSMGFDTGPANTLLDAWAQSHLLSDYDEDGKWARQGSVNPKLLSTLLKHPYFRQPPPKSADISQFSLQWLENFLRLHPEIHTMDVAATLVELSVSSIVQAIEEWAPDTQQVVACGGGCFNSFFMEKLAGKLAPRRICLSSDYGIDPAWVEATAFAWLAKQTLDKKPGNAPKSTGAKGLRILGGIYQA